MINIMDFRRYLNSYLSIAQSQRVFIEGSTLLFRALFILLVVTVASPANAWVDTDADGVPDKKDACSGTQKGVVVMANGCPDPDFLPPVEPQVAEQKATEQKQVTESSSETPVAGIVDSLVFEDCRSITAQSTSDNECQFTRISPVYFNFNQASVLLSQKPFLDELKKLLNLSSARLLLTGHADAIGSAQYNLNLSRERAENVKNILVNEYQFSADSIEIKAMGNTKPIADNATAEGRQRNRRVDITLVE